MSVRGVSDHFCQKGILVRDQVWNNKPRHNELQGERSALMCPRERAMSVALWRAGLLLCLWCVRSCLGEKCVLGIVGRPVSLPCFYPQMLPFVNFSIEWRHDDEVVLRSSWKEDGKVEIWSLNYATISTDAALTGNFSLELPAIHPKEDRMHYSLFIISQENQSTPACTACLRTAASFSAPLLQREDAAEGDEATFLCHSSGGYPQPAVYWLINNTDDPPEGSVTTQAASLPNSSLYNITSHLTVNVSKEASVSCVIKNLSMNETLTSTSYGVNGATVVVSRASEAMWIFSTVLCVVVGLMVVAGVVYQIHLDRINKRRKREYKQPERGYKRRYRYKGEAEDMKPEPKETDA
ncbi:ICOS ligand-like isoform 2-T2 [Odontesthes bonariensis]|uniref:ICOS ligand-like isoform X2 n=1 Tax=Odontesthes bonariensis TaxID=219752 RepID=UPI003F58325C